MFEQILLPLDGSPLSERALPYTIALAGAFGCPVRLLRVNSAPYTPPEAESFGVEVRNGAGVSECPPELAYLETIKPQFLAAKVPVTLGLEAGDPAERILERASGPVPTLVVMGTHGRGGVSRWVRGSVADRVVRHGSTPVFLIPGFVQKAPPVRRILIPLDGSPLAASILPSALQLCGQLCATAILFQAYQPEMGYSDWPKWEADRYLEAERDQLMRAHEPYVPIKTATRRGAAASTIVDFARRNQVDAIAMATHGRTGLVRWTLGSVADKVLHTTPVPMLLMRGQPSLD
jgi:nucleotide-binding universal stress UspA family protein